MKLVRTIVTCVLFATCLFPTASQAAVGKDADVTVLHSDGTSYTTEALNTSVCTSAIDTKGLRFLNLEFVYVWSSASAVTMTCDQSRAGAAPWFPIQVLSYTGFTATSAPHTWSQAVTASENWTWRVDLNAYQFTRCCVTGTGAGAGDTLTLTGFGGVD